MNVYALKNNIYPHPIFNSRVGRYKEKRFLISLVIFCLLTILGLVIISYDDDFLDNNDPPVIAFQSENIFYPSDEEVTFIQSNDPVALPLINKNSFLTRDPPI